MIEILSYCSYKRSDIPYIKFHADRIDAVLHSDDLTQAYQTLKHAFPYRKKIASFDSLVLRMYTEGVWRMTFEDYHSSMMIYLECWSILDPIQAEF
jgi:hypothetical protein